MMLTKIKRYERLFEDGAVTISTSIPKELRPEIPYSGDDSGNETDSEEVKRFKRKIRSDKRKA